MLSRQIYCLHIGGSKWLYHKQNDLLMRNFHIYDEQPLLWQFCLQNILSVNNEILLFFVGANSDWSLMRKMVRQKRMQYWSTAPERCVKRHFACQVFFRNFSDFEDNWGLKTKRILKNNIKFAQILCFQPHFQIMLEWRNYDVIRPQLNVSVPSPNF